MAGCNSTHSSGFTNAPKFRSLVLPTQFALLTLFGILLSGCSGGSSGTSRVYTPPNLDACPDLQVAAGKIVTSRLFATGFQIYRWSGTSWVFQAPEASLYRDAAHQNLVGTHYAGPTWESNSSKVVGTALDRCTPDTSTIPWLLLKGEATDTRGLFQGVTYIQRVNTTGGKAPDAPGGAVGEIAKVPYTAEYFFYRG